MKCKQCGANLAPGDRFCPECGCSVNGSQSAVDQWETQEHWVTQGNYQQTSNSYGQQYSGKKGSSGLKIAIVVALMAFIVALGILAFLLLKSSGDTETTEPSVAETQASVATTQQKVVSTTQKKAETTQQNTKAKKETTANAGDYILPDSSSKYLTSKDVAGLSSSELRLARNEIYARHGRLFHDDGLQSYFNGKSWYKGSISPDNFIDEERLSQLERDNIKLIQSYEN